MGDSIKERVTKPELIKWGVVIAITLILAFIVPASDFYNMEIRKFFTITACCIMIIAFELMPVLIPSICMMFAYVLSGIASIATVTTCFNTTNPYLAVGLLIFLEIIMDSGLLKRVAYWCAYITGGTWGGIVWGSFLAGFVTCFMTAGNSHAIMGAFAIGVIAAFNLGGKKAATAIGVVALMGAISGRSCIYSPALTLVEVTQTQLFLDDPNWSMNIVGVFMHNWPILIAFALMCLFVIKFCRPEDEIQGKMYFKTELEEMGKISFEEKGCAVILCMIIAWMLLYKVIPLASDYAFILLPWLLFLPGINIGKAKHINRMNYSIVFFVVACTGIGATASGLGLGQMIADMVLPVAQSAGNYAFLALVYFLTMILNFALTPFAIHACMAVPMLQVGTQLGIDPLAIDYMMMIGSDAIIMPYEYTPYLLVFGMGFMKMNEFMKLMSVKLVIMTVVLLAIIVPYWQLFGLW